MAKKGNKNRIGVVYSTADDFDYKHDNGEQEETLPNDEQRLEVHIEKKGRGGKTAVIIRGFVGSDEDLQQLAKQLKSKCGVGGSAKDGEIIIQGDKRDKVLEILKQEGYQTKRVGG